MTHAIFDKDNNLRVAYPRKVQAEAYIAGMSKPEEYTCQKGVFVREEVYDWMCKYNKGEAKFNGDMHKEFLSAGKEAV